MEYLDVDLEIEAGLGRDYPVVARSKVGEARLTMRFPYDEVVLESQLKDLHIALFQALQPIRKALLAEELHMHTMLSSEAQNRKGDGAVFSRSRTCDGCSPLGLYEY